MSERFDFQGETTDPIQTASEQADDKLKGVLSKLSKWRSVMVMGAMAIAALVFPLISTGFVDPFSVDFWFNAVYSLAIATLSYYMYAPFGTRSERLESTTYEKVIKRWTALSGQVRDDGLIEAFYEFCGVRREEERAERKALFIEAAGLPVRIYEELYAGLTPKQLKQKQREGELTRQQVKYLIAANGKIKVLPINPSMILSGLKVKNINDVGRKKRHKLFGLLRPLTLIVTMVIRSAIEIGGNEYISFVDYIAQAVTDLFTIVMWSFAGFRYGISMVRDEEQTVNGRSEFLSMFLERAKKTILKDKEETHHVEAVAPATE